MSDRAQRILIGAGLLALIVGIVLVDRRFATPRLAPFVIGLMGLAAFHEALGLRGKAMPSGLRRIAILGALLIVAALPLGGLTDWAPAPEFVLALAPPVFLALLAGWWVGARRRGGVRAADLEHVAFASLAAALALLPAVFLCATLTLPHGLLFTFAVVVGSKLNDIGGYLVGSALGRTKLAPGVSPNKSVEGSLAGLLLGSTGFALLFEIDTEVAEAVPWVARLFGGLALGLVTQGGDLLESAVKRAIGVKDSAQLIPTFGGTLDIVDSLILAAPLGYALGVHWLDPAGLPLLSTAG